MTEKELERFNVNVALSQIYAKTTALEEEMAALYGIQKALENDLKEISAPKDTRFIREVHETDKHTPELFQKERGSASSALCLVRPNKYSIEWLPAYFIESRYIPVERYWLVLKNERSCEKIKVEGTFWISPLGKRE